MHAHASYPSSMSMLNVPAWMQNQCIHSHRHTGHLCIRILLCMPCASPTALPTMMAVQAVHCNPSPHMQVHSMSPRVQLTGSSCKGRARWTTSSLWPHAHQHETLTSLIRSVCKRKGGLGVGCTDVCACGRGGKACILAHANVW